MRGLQPRGRRRRPAGLMSAVLDEAGFTSVVATNCEQEYHRYLRLGEQVTVRASLESVTGPKRTALGEGWFVTTRSTWYVGTEAVASMMFRVLKFRPPARPPAPAGLARPRRPATCCGRSCRADTAFFWDGTAAGELRIQRCGDCGALRHPPGPMCPACGAARPGYVVAAGTGEVYSYVVQHHPPVPGKQLPIVVALVALAEGVRMVGELLGAEPGAGAHRPAGPRRVRPGGRRADAARVAGGRADDQPRPAPAGCPELADRRDPDVRDRLRARHQRLPGRAPRPGPGGRAGQQGHLHQHPDHDGPGAAVRHRLGRAARRWCAQVAIRLGVPCYAGDTLTFSGPGDRGGRRGVLVEVVGRCSLGDHVTGTVRRGAAAGRRGAA